MSKPENDDGTPQPKPRSFKIPENDYIDYLVWRRMKQQEADAKKQEANRKEKEANKEPEPETPEDAGILI